MHTVSATTDPLVSTFNYVTYRLFKYVLLSLGLGEMDTTVKMNQATRESL